MTQTFKGRHMAMILVSFFGVVIGVNLIMARFAIATFSGTVVDNSYVASQNYNRWLADADRQEKLGWRPRIALDPARRVLISVSKDGDRLENVTVIGRATHPVGRASPIVLTFKTSAQDALLSDQSLPRGQWRLQLALRRGPDTLKLSQPVR